MLETERLFLRRYVPEDKANFIRLFTNRAVMKYVGNGVLTRKQAEAFWQKLFAELYPQNYRIWAVFARENACYVGHAGIYPRPQPSSNEWEFVYFLDREFWGNGYATEIARRVIRYGFENLNLRQVFTSVDDEHAASIRVMEKAGMSFDRYEFDDDGRFSVYKIERGTL